MACCVPELPHKIFVGTKPYRRALSSSRLSRLGLLPSFPVRSPPPPPPSGRLSVSLLCRLSRGKPSTGKTTRFPNAAQDLIRRLLTPNAAYRLGNLSGGIQDIMSHPMFQHAGFDWRELYNKRMIPPHKPKVVMQINVFSVSSLWAIRAKIACHVMSHPETAARLGEVNQQGLQKRLCLRA